MSNAAFKRNFSKLLEKAGDKADEVVRKVALDVGTSLIKKSPVDTGRFKGNWQWSIESRSTSQLSRLDNTPLGDFDQVGAALEGQSILKGYQTGQTVYITNSLPYAMKLEYGGYGDGPKTVGGYSQQAPQGMVRITVEEFSQAFRRAVAEVKST